MTDRLEYSIVSIFAIFMAFMFFWSPILITTLITIFLIVFISAKVYYKRKANADRLKLKSRVKTSSLVTIDNRFDANPSVRYIKTARRHYNSLYARPNDNNYVSNYLSNPLNTNYFLQSDGVLRAMSGQTLSSRPPSASDTCSLSNYRLTRESSNSQLGNTSSVKLSTSNRESTYELKLNAQQVKPVTVRIAPMPESMSRITLSRISNMTASYDPTIGSKEMSNKTSNLQSIADALKRKRGLKPDSETDDSIKITANKRVKRDQPIAPTNAHKIPNGFMPVINKQSIKRQTPDGQEFVVKKFKNNEIFSSYSSLKTPQSKNSSISKPIAKRKLTPDSVGSDEVKPKKGVTYEDITPDFTKLSSNITSDIMIEDTKSLLDIKQHEETDPVKTNEVLIQSFSMADHERDRNKAKNRLSRYLNAVKSVTSPKTDSNLLPSLVNKTSNEVNSEIGLPSEPAAVIFTNTKIDTSVTTTLLNTPISSVLTSTIGSISPQKQSVDNVDNVSMTSAPNSPEISTITTPFASSTPLLTSATTQFGGSKNISNEISLKSSDKNLTQTSSTPITTTTTTTTTPFLNSNNLFNGVINTTLSSSNILTAPSMPLFSSPTISIPDFNKIASNQAISFTAGLSAPTFPTPQQPISFSAESTSQSLFSLGTVSGPRRTQTSRLRNRKR